MRYIIIIFSIISLVLFSCSMSKKEYNNDYISPPVEEDASFVGGYDSLMRFIVDNLIYPEEALKGKIEGKVLTTFVVEVDGSISDIKVLRGLGYGCDEEAIRIIKLMPKWNPAIILSSKRKVRQQFVLPISFYIPTDEE